MRIVSPSVELLPEPKTPEDVLRHIEACGRVCYRSEDRITDGSAEKFVRMIIKRGHEAVLEHARITLTMESGIDRAYTRVVRDEMRSMGICDYLTGSHWGRLVSGNIRAWRAFLAFAHKMCLSMPETYARMVEGYPSLFEDLRLEMPEALQTKIHIPEPMTRSEREMHGWHTLRFVCDRGVSHEIVRHRPASYCQESTRYCNYSEDRFGGEIACVEPFFFSPGTRAYDIWLGNCETAEQAYFTLLDEGATAQEARGVLPTDLKTEIVMTADNPEWLHFLKLRTGEAAHPKMRLLAREAGRLLAEKDPEIFGEYGGKA